MDFDHLHLYVPDAKQSSSWFNQTLGFEQVAHQVTDQVCTEVLRAGSIYCLLSAPRSPSSPVAHFLQQHPPGVIDVAFRVKDVQASLERASDHGAKILQPLQTHHDQGKTRRWGKIQGWAGLEHTVLEREGQIGWLPLNGTDSPLEFSLPKEQGQSHPSMLTEIDHAVLNVGREHLSRVVQWYQEVMGFQTQRAFDIQTDHSALRSEVLTHPQGQAKFPINEPASANSQVQEFLDANRGPGIQHIALRTTDIIKAVAQLRAAGLSLLEIPRSYYQQLRQQFEGHYPDLNWAGIADQQILVDVEATPSTGILMQAFTQPIFTQPTLFLEIIERQGLAQGFGQGNFLALFQAIEREQMKRGTDRSGNGVC
ncbi:MAG: 4-hydroxyphenylpyruvate dioxygenase [Acaryochloridaceae cyanobacterium SU_2_1]|nr:4-hydroxyphenylpyruvate dioxygenase [Acaryochloridaceae cyanobacterium SU_2_1]